MTVINVVPAVVALSSGSAVASGMVQCTPWRGSQAAVVTAGASVVFPQPLEVPVQAGTPVVPVDLVPGDGTWCWQIVVSVGAYSVTRYVTVPASGPVNWGALVDVDPTTFTPNPASVAAWQVNAVLYVPSSNVSGNVDLSVVSQQSIIHYTLTGNVTVTALPASPVPGMTITLVATQDATGGRTITFPAGVKLPAGLALPLASTAAAVSVVHLWWSGAIWVAVLGAAGVA